MARKMLYECTWIEITQKITAELWENQTWHTAILYPGLRLRVVRFMPGTTSHFWEFETKSSKYKFRIAESILQLNPLPWKEYQSDTQTSPTKATYPRNNDGRTTCAWCGAPTRKAGEGRYDICIKCGR